MMKNSAVKRKLPGAKKLHWALGNRKLYETYVVALIRYFGLKPDKYPPNQFNEYGVNHYYSLFEVKDIHQKISEVIEDNKDKKLTIDPVAVESLTTLIQILNSRDINYIIYFHPLPERILESKKEEYENFAAVIRSIVKNDSKIVDFNASQYRDFITDYSNYIDHGHLSHSGQQKLTAMLTEKIELGAAVGTLSQPVTPGGQRHLKVAVM